MCDVLLPPGVNRICDVLLPPGVNRMCDLLLPPGVNPTAVKYIHHHHHHHQVDLYVKTKCCDNDIPTIKVNKEYSSQYQMYSSSHAVHLTKTCLR
jgi:hypothetical protein